MFDTNQLDRRPLAVKISNAPPSYTRPQSGLDSADIVFEHVTEGSITRFTAIFYGESPERVGPIRSARLIDLELPVMYDAALVYSGSSIGVSRKLFNSSFASRILRTNTNGYYRTGENKPYEHTLYARPEELWESLSLKGENRRPQFVNYMTFTSEPPAGATQASGVQVEYPNFSEIVWRFDDESGRYLRWVDSEVHTDALTGNQLSATNVVLLVVEHQLDTTICEFQVGNQCRAYSTEILISGGGSAYVFRDGLVYKASWQRLQPEHVITIQDGQGMQLPLQIGNTWFQIIPADYADPFIILAQE